MKKVFLVIVVVIVILGAVTWSVLQQPQFGGKIEGARLQQIKDSPLYSGKRLENKPPQSQNMEWLNTLKYYTHGQIREPQFEVPVIPVSSTQLEGKAAEGLSATWLGHASVLVEMDGHRLMTDPVLSDVVSPIPLIYGPKRLHAAPIAIQDLKGIDAVLISHDHYDHLDMETIKALGAKGSVFFVPLGIGAHLERWGIDTKQIREMQWWETAQLGSLRIHCTPARHYSGRKAVDNSTLWSSWFVTSEKNSFYFSGDTGYAPHFKEIKQRLGPVNLTLMKVGAYGKPEGWVDIHMTPESAVQAHRDLGGEVLLPIHWATFNLAYHAWEEPIERTLKAAEQNPAVKVITPKVGERFEMNQPFENTVWYKK